MNKNKLKFYVIFLMGISISCTEYEEQASPATLIGKWKLIEQLADPGDGNGTFASITSNKTISLFGDGTFSSNGVMCAMDISSNQTTTGVYSTTAGNLTPAGCNLAIGKIGYEIKDNNLIISYPCIEPCLQKYSKMNSATGN